MNRILSSTQSTDNLYLEFRQVPEEEEEEMEMDADEEWDGPEWILPVSGATHLPSPTPPASDSESSD
ncbi:hypothetical protein Tco_0180734 [Tanacetum coccineum]